MPSPFPGMDPYLENPILWPDVHQSLITYIRDALQPHIRPQYHARIGERLYLVEVPHSIYPDITLIRRPLHDKSPMGSGEALAVLDADIMEADEPYELLFPPQEIREPYIEIIHSGGGEVVTVIEVLSPSNKTPGEGRDLYRLKQEEILESRAHLVEIDLLSQGWPTIAPALDQLADTRPWRYVVSVSRFPNRQRFQVYTIPLEKRLPRIRVPLKAPDPDVVLDLQAVFNRCYDNGGYADFINYTRPPTVPLADAERALTEELFREHPA